MLTTVIEAIHSGMTNNLNFYPKRELEKALNSWLEPYNKPVLKHHDIHSEPIGRVVGARLKRSALKKNAYCAELTLNITDEDAAKKIEDGRYQTVSIGSVITKAVCSICKNDWASGSWCEHKKGQVYDGKLCYWEVEIGEHFEVSFVNQPADPYAQVIHVSTNKATESQDGEGAGNIPNRRRDEEIMKDTKAIEEIVDAFNSTEEEEVNQDTGEQEEAGVKEADEAAEKDNVMDKLREEIEGIRSKVEALESQLVEAQSKFAAVIEQSVELARIISEELVHHYADLAVASGIFQNAEEAEKEAAGKSAKELRREILKLSSEINSKIERTVETVNCPGGEGVVEEKVATDGQSNSYTLKDLEDVMLKLLGSK